MSERRPLVVIHRQVLFDVAENAKEIAEAAGLPPISDEVAEMERKASLLRLSRVARLEPMLADHSGFLAAVFVAIQKGSAVRQGLEVLDDSWLMAHEHLTRMLNAGCMSLVSVLVDLGVLHLDADWEQTSEQQEEQRP